MFDRYLSVPPPWQNWRVLKNFQRPPKFFRRTPFLWKKFWRPPFWAKNYMGPSLAKMEICLYHHNMCYKSIFSYLRVVSIFQNPFLSRNFQRHPFFRVEISKDPLNFRQNFEDPTRFTKRWVHLNIEHCLTTWSVQVKGVSRRSRAMSLLVEEGEL